MRSTDIFRDLPTPEVLPEGLEAIEQIGLHIIEMSQMTEPVEAPGLHGGEVRSRDHFCAYPMAWWETDLRPTKPTHFERWPAVLNIVDKRARDLGVLLTARAMIDPDTFIIQAFYVSSALPNRGLRRIVNTAVPFDTAFAFADALHASASPVDLQRPLNRVQLIDYTKAIATI